MRGLLGFFVLFIFIILLFFQLPDQSEEARELTLSVAGYCRAGNVQKLMANMHFSTLREEPSQAPLVLSSRKIDSLWLWEIAQHGFWGKGESLLGKLEIKRLSQWAQIPERKIYALVYKKSYIAFVSNQNPSQKTFWKILACHLSPWQGVQVLLSGRGEGGIFLAIENGRIWFQKGEYVDSLDIETYFSP